MAMGFRVSRNPIQALVDDEPYDIQMECMIGDKEKFRNSMT